MIQRLGQSVRTGTGSYIIDGVHYKVHPKILAAQERYAKIQQRVGEKRALDQIKKEYARGAA